MTKLYKTFMRHAAKVTRSPAIGEREVLTGVKHYENGSLAVTDSHRLYVAKGLHDKGEALLTPKGAKVEGKYPDIDRLIPDELDARSIEMNLAEMLQAVDVLNTAAKIEDYDISWQGNLLTTLGNGEAPEHLIKASYEIPYSLPIPEGDRMIFDPAYLLEALQLFKAFKYEELAFHFHDKYRPAVLMAPDGKLFAIVLPKRRY